MRRKDSKTGVVVLIDSYSRAGRTLLLGSHLALKTLFGAVGLQKERSGIDTACAALLLV